MGIIIGYKYPMDNIAFNFDLNSDISYPGSGNVLYDLSNNKYNATLVNSPTYDFSNPNQKFLTFNGSNQYGDMSAHWSGLMNLGNNWSIVGYYRTLAINSATHTLWSNLEAYDPQSKGNATVWGFNVGYDEGNTGWSMSNFTGNLSLKVMYGTGSVFDVRKAQAAANTISTPDWMCIVVVFRNVGGLTYIEFYKNGVLVGTYNSSSIAWPPAYGGGGYRQSQGAPIRIASTNAYWIYDSWQKVSYSNIALNKLTLYKKSLSIDEVGQIYGGFRTRFNI